MRILVIAIGSTGDVAPYTGLGARLAAAGHHVAFAALSDMGDLVTGAGLEFRSLPGEARTAMAAAGPGGGRRTGAVGDGIRVIRVVASLMDAINGGIVAAAEKGTDLVISPYVTVLPVACVAEARSIPLVCVQTVPAHPTGSFPPAVGLPSLGTVGNRVAHRSALGFTFAALAPSTRRLRRRLGLGRKGVFEMARQLEAAEVPVCYAVSPTVLPRPPDWRKGVEMVGYLWPPRPSDWAPPPQLVEFLAAGPPPVYVGFGSLGVGAGEQLSSVSVEALRRAGVRGIVQSGWAGLSAAGDDVMTIGHIPHDWLFPRMSAVVHHAGPGTAAAALRAGVPSVPVPITWDQPFWARRLHDLGTAPTVLPHRRLSAAATRRRHPCCPRSSPIPLKGGGVGGGSELRGRRGRDHRRHRAVGLDGDQPPHRPASMKVLIVAIGSTGDVAPYTGLGRRLVAAGHQLTVAALSDMADQVTAAGLEFRALPWRAKDSLAVAGGLGRGRTSIGDGLRALRAVTGVVDELNNAILAAAKEGPDVIVSHGGAVLPVACVAEALSIPMLCSSHHPRPSHRCVPAPAGTALPRPFRKSPGSSDGHADFIHCTGRFHPSAAAAIGTRSPEPARRVHDSGAFPGAGPLHGQSDRPAPTDGLAPRYRSGRLPLAGVARGVAPSSRNGRLPG